MMVVIALMCSTTFGQAEDVIIPDLDDLPPEYTPTVTVTGWYLRADLGYSALTQDYVSSRPVPGTALEKFGGQNLEKAWALQGGLGYQITDTFRMDATLTHHFKADFTGRSSGSEHFDCNLLSADNFSLDTDCSAAGSSSLNATVVLANAYLDLGTINGFTPYVGGGIGAAKIKWDDFTNNFSCAGAIGDCLNALGENYNTFHDSIHSGIEQTRFAWALHAGTSYQLNCRTKIDAGYSYTRIEGGDFFGFSATSTSAAAPGVSGFHDDVEIHSGRIGIRYSLDAAACSETTPTVSLGPS